MDEMNVQLGEYLTNSFDALVTALLILLCGIVMIRIAMVILGKILKVGKQEKAAHSLIKSLVRAVLYLLLAMTVLGSLGVDVTGVIALASVLTLASSLAVQDALSNIIGGFTLICTRPFTIGDFVEIGGQSGTVTNIGLNYTKLLTGDRKTISMPNRTIVSSQIINFTVEGTRRVDINISASYNDEPEDVIEALKIAAQIPTALQEPAPYAAVTAYNDSNIGYILQVWCKSEDYWSTMHTVNHNIRKAFKDKGICMTYPHLNVHIDK